MESDLYTRSTHISYADIQSAKADISDSAAKIQSSFSGIGDPIYSRVAKETRPANMRVTWIMKVEHFSTKPQSGKMTKFSHECHNLLVNN